MSEENKTIFGSGRTCPDCRGFGVVNDYSGNDFNGAKDCRSCGGGGQFYPELYIETVVDDMFTMGADGITNPCNVKGVAGAGLSALFRVKYPDNHVEYVRACRQKTLRRGTVLMTFNEDRTPPWIFNFPAKPDYRINSTLDDIDCAMPAFIERIKEAQENGLRSVVIPALGSGLGGLLWSDVEPIVRRHLEEAVWEESLHVYLIPPK